MCGAVEVCGCAEGGVEADVFGSEGGSVGGEDEVGCLEGIGGGRGSRPGS